MKRILIIFVSLLGVMPLAAQQPPMGGGMPPQHRQGPPQQESCETRAIRRAVELKKQLGLDSKQFDKVYKLYLDEYTAMEENMSSGGFPGGMPPGGMPPSGGFGGGMPSGMSMDMMSAPTEQQTVAREQTHKEMEKARARREKKMRKILTAEQMERWLQLDTPPAPPAPPSSHESVSAPDGF